VGYLSHISNLDIRNDNIRYCIEPLDILPDEPSRHEVPYHVI